MTTWPRENDDFIAIRPCDLPSRCEGTLCPVHPTEHVLFLEEVAAALNLRIEEVKKLIADGKLERGIFIKRGLGHQPYFVSLADLVAFEVGTCLRKSLIPHLRDQDLIEEFLDDVIYSLEEPEASSKNRNITNLQNWVFSISVNSLRGLTYWKSFKTKNTKLLFVSAFCEWLGASD